MDNKLFEELISPYATKVDEEVIPTYRVKYQLYVKKYIDIISGQEEVVFDVNGKIKGKNGRPKKEEAYYRQRQKEQREADIRAEKKRIKEAKAALLTPRQIAQREKAAKAYAAKKVKKEQDND